MWEYTVSHGNLLIRSPISPRLSDGRPAALTNLDLRCVDTVYLEIPRFIAGIEFVEPTELETARVRNAIGAFSEGQDLRVISSQGHRYLICASHYVEDENEMEPGAPFFWDASGKRMDRL